MLSVEWTQSSVSFNIQFNIQHSTFNIRRSDQATTGNRPIARRFDEARVPSLKWRHPRSPTSARGCRRARVPPLQSRLPSGDTLEPGVLARGDQHARMPPLRSRIRSRQQSKKCHGQRKATTAQTDAVRREEESAGRREWREAQAPAEGTGARRVRKRRSLQTE